MFGNINKFQARITELENARDSDYSKMKAMQAEMDDYKKTIASFPGLKTQYDLEKTQLVSAHSKEIESLQMEIKKEKTSVARKVNEAIANAGLNNSFLLDNITISPVLSKEQILENFQSLPKEKQTEYYQKNKEVISQALLGS